MLSYSSVLGLGGDWMPISDYDLLVVADFDEPFLDRIYQLSSLVEGLMPVEFHPYRLEEVREMLGRGVVSIVDALEEGVSLYESTSFQEIRKTFREMKKKGLRKSSTAVILPEER